MPTAALGLATETDSALAATGSKARGVGRADSVESALPLYPNHPGLYPAPTSILFSQAVAPEGVINQPITLGSNWFPATVSFRTQCYLHIPAELVEPPTSLQMVYVDPNETYDPGVSAATVFRALNQTTAAPTLDGDYGRPSVHSWYPTSVVYSSWGRIQVVIDGVDHTFDRDAPCYLSRWSYALPYSDSTLQVRFPQYSALEPLPSFLTGQKNIELFRVDPVTGLPDAEPFWEGMIKVLEDVVDEDSAPGLTVSCVGANYQLDDFLRLPGIDDTPIDIGTILPVQWSHGSRPSLRTQECDTVTTGILTRKRGAGQRLLTGYISEELSKAVTDDGSDQWTIIKEPFRKPRMVLKSQIGSTWTIQCGGYGVAHKLNYDYQFGVNVYYGEGTDAAGQRWRYGFPNTQGAKAIYYQPISFSMVVHTIIDNGDGTTHVDTSQFDTSVPRIEQMIQFGQGVDLAEGMRAAEAIRLRVASVTWFGQVVLRTDPVEGSRLDIRAGDRVTYKTHHGVDRLLYVVAVEVSMDEGWPVVTLTVDTVNRDLLEVKGLIDRVKDVNSPTRQLRIGRDSELSIDSHAPWDASAGYGWLPTKRFFDGTSVVTMPQGQWVITPVFVAEKGSIIKAEFYADSSSTIMHISLYTRPITTDDLPTDPLVQNTWKLNTKWRDGFVVGWGQYGQAGGYSPGLESESDSPTGAIIDETGYPYECNMDYAPPRLWVAAWFRNRAGNLHGNLHHGDV